MSEKPYDLEERTSSFGGEVVWLCRGFRLDAVITPLISQLVRSATSIGANYMEANSASSKKDFRNKIYICKKEAQETLHWLKMLKQAEPAKEDKIKELYKECHEFVLIFGRIVSTLNNKNS